MPTYDYTCFNCKQRFDIYLTYQEYGVKSVKCPHCGSDNVHRRVPRVRALRSEESRLESMADPSSLAGLEDDPVAMGRMLRKMGSELGEEVPPEFGEVVDRLEAGQSPEDIEGALPDMGVGDTGGNDDDL